MSNDAKSPLETLRVVLRSLGTIPPDADPYPADLPSQVLSKVRTALGEIREWDLGRAGVERDDVPKLAELVDKALVPLQWVKEEWEDHGGILDRSGPREAVFELCSVLLGLRARCYVAERLRKHRQTGLSLRNVSNNVGLAHAYLGQIERCAAGLPSIESAQLLLSELGIPLWKQGTAQPPRVHPVSDEEKHDRYLALKALRQHTDRLPTAAVRHLASMAKSLQNVIAE